MTDRNNWTAIVLEHRGDWLPDVGTETVITARLGDDIHGRALMAFRPHEYLFNNPHDWRITEYRIGLYSQLRTADGFIAADIFGALIRGGAQTIQAHQDYMMHVHPLKPGLRFRCTMAGVAIFADGINR